MISPASHACVMVIGKPYARHEMGQTGVKRGKEIYPFPLLPKIAGINID